MYARLLQVVDTAERGDVPGWVLVTIMTAALVVALFGVASPLLGNVFSKAVNAVGGLTP
jgi:hypothetical protein